MTATGDPDTAPPAAIELWTTKANDLTLALVGLPLGAIALWHTVAGLRAWEFSEPGSGPEAALFDWAQVTFGPAALAAVFALFTFWLVCLGVGGIWRLIDRRPAIAADRNGLRSHPSICSRAAAWNEVRSIRTVEGTRRRLRVALRRRFWSTTAWRTSTAIELYCVALGLTEFECSTAVDRFWALAPGQLANPDL